MDKTLERRPAYEDEISLVDLAITFIRRRRVFYVVFLTTTLVGLAYSLLLMPEKYEYISLFQMAEEDSSNTIESPATTIATLQNRWLPEVQVNHRQVEEKELPFGISFSNPENTGLIRMSSEASPDNAALVKETHEKLIEQIEKRQALLMAREKKSLESRIEALDQAVKSLQGEEGTGSVIAEVYEKRVALKGDLERLKPGETLVVSRESAERIGTSQRLIVLLAAFLGAIMGVILAFFAEFVVLVRERLRERSA